MSDILVFNNKFRPLRPKSSIDWIALCVLIFSFGGLISFYIPNNGIQNFAGLLFLLVLVFSKKMIPFNGLAGLIYILLICYTLYNTYITFSEHYHYVMHVTNKSLTNIFRSILFVPNFLPFVLLCIKKENPNIRYILSFASLLLCCYIYYYPFAFINMVTFKFNFNAAGEWGESGTYGDFISNSTLGISSISVPVFVVYLKKYLNVKQWKWYLLAYLGGCILSIYMARRGAVVIQLLYLVSCWLIYMLYDNNTSRIKVVIVTIAYLAIFYMMFLGGGDTLFANLLSRGSEDTRSGVELNFWLDMDEQSIMFGRGWFGEYYEHFAADNRPWIETGYLSLILRGGVIYLILYVSLLLLSAIKGIFFSKNIMLKSMGTIILISLIELYPYGWPQFNINYLIIWLGVYLCNQKEYRNLSDLEVYNLYFK